MQASKWKLDKPPLIKQLLSAFDHLKPVKDRKPKFIFHVGILKAILPLIYSDNGGTVPTHDDICLLAACSIAIHALLRGGEFLFVPRKREPLPRLLGRHIVLRPEHDRMDIAIVKDKVKFWREARTLFVYDTPNDCAPIKLWRTYLQSAEKNSIRLMRDGPAFVMANGKPLSQKVAFCRLRQLLIQRGVLSDDTHQLFMASFRAGGAVSLRRAGVPDNVIKRIGRRKRCMEALCTGRPLPGRKVC